MISINSVHYGTIKKSSRFAVNPQYLHNIAAQEPLRRRIDCTLRAKTFSTSRIPGNSKIEFVCKSQDHANKFCTDIRSALPLAQNLFYANNGSRGNILLQLYRGRCHSCGIDSSRCWLEYTGHRICSTCVAKGTGIAPFPYGHTDRLCCRQKGCGASLSWYRKPDSELYEEAIEIYERHTAG
jgi:hypothetical protein